MSEGLVWPRETCGTTEPEVGSIAGKATAQALLTAVGTPDRRLLPGGGGRDRQAIREGLLGKLGGQDATEGQLAAVEAHLDCALAHAQPGRNLGLWHVVDVLLDQRHPSRRRKAC